MKSKVTIRDVAYLSGVSISTVSRVVSGKTNVSKDTFNKVQKAIEQTGYQPNYTAKALATNLTDTIAVIIDRTPSQGFENSFFLDALNGIVTKLNEFEKDMILVFTNPEDKHIDQGLKRLINTNKIDACIKLSVVKDDKTLEYLIENDTPTVVVGRVEDSDVMTVNNNNKNAMKSATNHLIEKGNKKIAFVGGSIDYIVTLDRRDGFIEAMDKSNIEFDDNNFYYTEFTKHAGYELSKELIVNGFDAVACTDDLLAYGISKGYFENNKDIDIVSFNNSYLSEIANIPISSVDINSKLLGEEAVNLLFNENNDKNIIVKSKLIIRS